MSTSKLPTVKMSKISENAESKLVDILTVGNKEVDILIVGNLEVNILTVSDFEVDILSFGNLGVDILNVGNLEVGIRTKSPIIMFRIRMRIKFPLLPTPKLGFGGGYE
jgi:hypothetical protein